MSVCDVIFVLKYCYVIVRIYFRLGICCKICWSNKIATIILKALEYLRLMPKIVSIWVFGILTVEKFKTFSKCFIIGLYTIGSWFLSRSICSSLYANLLHASIKFCTSAFRRQSTDCDKLILGEQPTDFASVYVFKSVFWLLTAHGARTDPLRKTARLNKPLAFGELANMLADAAPALSPITVEIRK